MEGWRECSYETVRHGGSSIAGLCGILLQLLESPLLSRDNGILLLDHLFKSRNLLLQLGRRALKLLLDRVIPVDELLDGGSLALHEREALVLDEVNVG